MNRHETVNDMCVCTDDRCNIYTPCDTCIVDSIPSISPCNSLCTRVRTAWCMNDCTTTMHTYSMYVCARTTLGIRVAHNDIESRSRLRPISILRWHEHCLSFSHMIDIRFANRPIDVRNLSQRYTHVPRPTTISCVSTCTHNDHERGSSTPNESPTVPQYDTYPKRVAATSPKRLDHGLKPASLAFFSLGYAVPSGPMYLICGVLHTCTYHEHPL